MNNQPLVVTFENKERFIIFPDAVTVKAHVACFVSDVDFLI